MDQKERQREWYLRNRERILAKMASPEERAKVRERRREQYANDPEYRDKIKRASQRWREKPESKQLIAASAKRWSDSGRGQEIKRADRLRRYFNLSIEQYDAMLAEQGGVCAICKQPETRLHRGRGRLVALSVDHDHRCCPGKTSCGRCVRGLLCDRCNVGRWPDEPALLRAAADYFERYL